MSSPISLSSSASEGLEEVEITGPISEEGVPQKNSASSSPGVPSQEAIMTDNKDSKRKDRRTPPRLSSRIHTMAPTEKRSSPRSSAVGPDNQNTNSVFVRSRSKRSNDDDEYTATAPVLTTEDLQLCQQLDQQYLQALEERDVSYSARYQSVRQSACFSVSFMLIYLTLATIFFQQQAGWDVHNALLYSIVTITTVGFGNLDSPETVEFQWFTIIFILLGIATLTIMVAQVYQCIMLEASRAQHLRDTHDGLWKTNNTVHSTDGVRRGDIRHASSSRHRSSPEGLTVEVSSSVDAEPDIESTQISDDIAYVYRTVLTTFWMLWDKLRLLCQLYPSLTVILPMFGLVMLGALVMMALEDWTLTEALYFSVVSLTTVGFGDYYPTHPASIWFCILWLPCSVGFLSVYLAHVAAWYIHLSDRNIQRIERQLRHQLNRNKQKVARDREEIRQRALRGQRMSALAKLDEENVTENAAKRQDDDLPCTDDADTIGVVSDNHSSNSAEYEPAVMHRFTGFNSLPLTSKNTTSRSRSNGSSVVMGGSLASDDDDISMRREKIIANSRVDSRGYGNESGGSSVSEVPRMATMRDILCTIRTNLPLNEEFRAGLESSFLSIKSSQPLDSSGLIQRRGSARKPSFALRALVQERFAEIIATEIAGYHSLWEIQDCTLSLTIYKLHSVADKWFIPRRARKAFRSTALEVLYFVGEHGLVTKGAEALFALTPLEFHELFAPLLAALGDAETMEVWLHRTNILAEVDLKHDDTAVTKSISM